uniref:RNA-dependent RNA polymerase n=1 Tax=Heterobasidion ambi-like virus 14 TaxID=3075968 RepID=A0AA96C2X1_9VIRU|nr:RNA-dependent RNA polymerase [Heterobasidion ambi-like virus 14]
MHPKGGPRFSKENSQVCPFKVYVMSILVKSFIQSGHFDLALLTESLPLMTIAQRKVLLSFCRVQNAQNYRLKADLHALQSSQQDTFVYRDTICHLQDVLDNLEKYRFQPLTLGLMSMIIRTVYHDDETELENAISKSFDKEFLAATTPAVEPSFNFSCFLSENVLDRDIPLSPSHEPSPHMGYKLHIGLALLRDRMMRDQPLIPTYSRSKNCSRSMARSFCDYSNSPLKLSEITTLECMKFYGQSGIRASGHTEMRSVFRFTDLAPRTYYSTGGLSYWDACYMKKFCYELTTLLPTCSPKDHIRSNIQRLHYQPGNTVLLYDYSSFTSSLPAMSKFTNDLSHFFSGCVLKIFDPFEGVVHIDVGEMLRNYNLSVNQDLLFDVGRLVESDEYGMDESFYMANNGPLGAQGNINLSMLLHAINITAAQDNLDRQNCVGDDAIVVFDERRYSKGYFIVIINLLGAVNESKTIWMRAYQHQTSRQREDEGWHFMKRPIVVYWEYIWTGTLIDFPNTYIWEKPDTYHIQRPEGIRIVTTFLGQVSSFFDDCLLHSTDISGEEMELALELLRSLYHRLRLPIRGAFPGYRVRIQRFHIDEAIKFQAIPALDIENYGRSWREVLWDGVDDIEDFEDIERDCNQRMMRMSYEWTECTKSKIMALLSDFGYGEMKLVTRRYARTMEDRSIWLDPERNIPVYRFRMCSDLPEPFVELLGAYNLDTFVISTD